jgi:lipopolysaccharide export system permease protein
VPLLQRYILGQLFRVFMAVLAVLTIVMIVGGVFREVSAHGLGIFQSLQILPYIIPSLLPFAIPIAVLMTVCIVFGRMAADREITAAKAAGIPVLTMLWPALFLGGVLSAGSLLLTDQVIPWSVGNIRRVVASTMEDIVLDMLKTHNELVLPKGGMSISVRGVAGRTLIRPILKYTAAGGQTVTAQARQARLAFELEHGRILLALSDCHLDIPGRGSFWFAEVTRSLPLPGSRKQAKPRHMSLDTLKRELEQGLAERVDLADAQAIRTVFHLTTGRFDQLALSGNGEPARAREAAQETHNRLRTELHGRIAFSSSCFFFVLVGAPFAISQARRQVLTNFLTCFLPITLIYYPIVMLCMNQSRTGLVNPAWAMWIGNLLLLLVGLAALRDCRRH